MSGLPLDARKIGKWRCPLYQWAFHAAWHWRKHTGKIMLERADEYRGITTIPRPEGRLIWLHGASVGESLSTLPLITLLQQQYPDVTILLTSTTRGSSEVLQASLPKGVIHQFLPLDHLKWVQRFYDHWQPELGVWFESEFWPNLCLEADQRRIPRVLLNGKISQKSFNRWSFVPSLSKAIIAGFTEIRVQDQQNYVYFYSFGATHVRIGAHSKDVAEQLPCDHALLQKWQNNTHNRPFWLATSTHADEEESVLAAHQLLRQEFPDLLCILVPRHKERGKKLLSQIQQKADFLIQLDSDSTQFNPDCGLYIFDVFGQLGTLYRLADMAFIGGSLVPEGGHNMREAILLQCLPIVGPHLENFSKHKAYFRGHYQQIFDAQSLAEAIATGLRDPNQIKERAVLAQKEAEPQSKEFAVEILEILGSVLKPEKHHAEILSAQ